MISDHQGVLKQAFPGEEARYCTPMTIGHTSAIADQGAALILAGIKTATSSVFWDYPDGQIPFAGALSVLLDGAGRHRAIVETQRVEIMPFGAADEAFARAYGEGERTLTWFRSTIGAWYRERATEQGESFSDETPIICEWIAVVRRLESALDL